MHGVTMKIKEKDISLPRSVHLSSVALPQKVSGLHPQHFTHHHLAARLRLKYRFTFHLTRLLIVAAQSRILASTFRFISYGARPSVGKAAATYEGGLISFASTYIENEGEKIF